MGPQSRTRCAKCPKLPWRRLEQHTGRTKTLSSSSPTLQCPNSDNGRSYSQTKEKSYFPLVPLITMLRHEKDFVILKDLKPSHPAGLLSSVCAPLVTSDCCVVIPNTHAHPK